MPSRPATDAPVATTPSGNWFPSFFDQAPHFAVLLAPDGTVAEANRVSLEAGGYARADVAGRAFWECGWWDGAPGLAGQVRASVEATAGGDTVRVEVPHFCANGERRFIGLVLAPVTGADGAPLFIAVTGTDVTERYRVEERLRLLDRIGEATRVASDPKVIMDEATRLLGEYLGATRVAYADLEADNDRFTIRHDWRVPGAISTVGVYSLDLFGSRARANLRMGRNLVIGDVDRELAPEDGKDMFNQIGIKAIVCCGLAKGGRLVAMMAVHQEQPRAWTIEEVALVDAVVERCWAHIERVRSTEALRAADRHKSEFLATLAHELRNPLAPLRNGLDILRLADGNPALRVSVRDTMDRQLRHMTHLVSDLLDIARVASGKIVLQKEIVDVRAVVESAVESTAPLVEGARHRLSVTLPDVPVAIEADAVRMSQVIGNLLTNAAKYTAPGGRITLDVALDRVPEGDAVVIAVADDGIGIPAEALGAVFEMFTQVAKNIDRANGGLGIGLSLVKKLVELHGGTVRAASPGPGQGSTFTIRLPLAVQGLPPAGAEDDAPMPQDGHGPRRLRVLVADDNADAARILAGLLELEGHEVRIAADGVEALDAAAAFLPQLAFLDIGMPRMDGYETARRLRAMPQLAALTLVALTGWGAAEDRARSQAAGFDRHLLKPAAAEDIRAALAGAAGRDDQGL
ncbi:PAS domain-containing hybrid sensor histidine kinase/response regulator [Massilia sp. TN1-12]|uniref:PAS domain-containing hybrid sensor histidine kinase/response regulator n=1 Tax=Massilia paldalensis TaxID=3377675 RepID=UPI00384A4C6F